MKIMASRFFSFVVMGLIVILLIALERWNDSHFNK